ncbi:MAG: VIT domain-containing protein, partial [Tepidisphaeraceae bacterium]
MKCARRLAAVSILATLTIAIGIFVGCATTGRHGGAGVGSPVPASRSPGYAGTLQDELLQPPGTLPSRSEELWVIAKAEQDTDASSAKDDQVPGTGALVTKRPGSDQPVPIPLKQTDVRASIAGYIATVEVRQQYHNPYDSKIEAVYVFPLPSDAAVSEFVMTIGERHIRGIIREREEAQKIYNEARSQGYVASLLTQERPNIFTQSVANIEPGKQIDIDIKYFNSLAYDDGWYEFVFPMVVGPRFNPPGSAGGVGAVARGAHGTSGQSTEVQYLKPGERSGHDIALTLNLEAGVSIEKIDSRNHGIDVRRITETHSEITLKDSDTIPNKDFVLRYKVAGDQIKTALMTQRDPKTGAGYFTLMVFPPESLKGLPRKPLEMVYTIDVSGSMSGKPIAQALAAVRYALKHMQSSDSFQIVAFSGAASQMAGEPLPATPENVSRGLHYLNDLRAGGGTMMLEGIRRSLDFPHDENRLRFVAFLTDGYIGNEIEILRALHNSL